MPEETKPAGANGGFREILVSEWKAHQKNTLLGFLALRLPSGLVLCNVSLHEQNGKRWLSMPSRPYKGDDGTDRWQPLILFTTPEHRERFQAAALDAVDRYFAGGRDG
jgi:hypothetical protein